jgi:hypothetical protein
MDIQSEWEIIKIEILESHKTTRYTFRSVEEFHDGKLKYRRVVDIHTPRGLENAWLRLGEYVNKKFIL